MKTGLGDGPLLPTKREREQLDLIKAAAPDLYRAPKRLVTECGEGGQNGRAIDLLPAETIRLAHTALRKAEG